LAKPERELPSKREGSGENVETLQSFWTDYRADKQEQPSLEPNGLTLASVWLWSKQGRHNSEWWEQGATATRLSGLESGLREPKADAVHTGFGLWSGGEGG
jgi:hypothetical protein